LGERGKGGDVLEVGITGLVFLEVCPYCGSLIARDGKVVAEATTGVNDCFAGLFWGSDGCTRDDLGCSHGGYIWALVGEMSEVLRIEGKGLTLAGKLGLNAPPVFGAFKYPP
jgi:hypothetical protein